MTANQNTRLSLVDGSDPKMFTATGNWGTLVCDTVTGVVILYDRDNSDWEKEGDGYDNITRLDVDEWRRTYPGGDISAGHDIIDFGSWDTDGVYCAPEWDWRFNLWMDRENYAEEKWRIVPRLGEEAREKYRAWLEGKDKADRYVVKALALLNSGEH